MHRNVRYGAPVHSTAVTTESAVQALAPSWARMLAGHPTASPFNSPGWALAWWDAWWRQPAPDAIEWRCIVTADRYGQLHGVLPLVRFPDGVTRYVAPELVDLATALIEKDQLAPFWSSTAIALRNCDGPGRLAIPRAGDADQAAMALAGLDVRVEDVEPCALINLPSTWDHYWSGLSAGQRKLWRSERRRLADEHGTVSLNVCQAPEELPSRLGQFWELREQSWRQRGRYSELAPGSVGQRLRWFLAAVASRAALGLHPVVARTLVEDAVAAMSLMFFAGDRVWYYMAAYDVGFARYGVGRMLLADCIRYAIETAGLATFDLGRGIEPYKFTLGARRYDLANISIEL
jgi:CelD/BcsL family acetyltransferase involved in cellulose biosynthesis